MKKKVFRERYNKGFTFTVDDVDGYKEGAIEKVIKTAKKTAKANKKTAKGDK